MAVLVTEGAWNAPASVSAVNGCNISTDVTRTSEPAPASPMNVVSARRGTAPLRSRTAIARPLAAVAVSNASVVRHRIREMDMKRAFLLQLILSFSIYK